MHAMYTEDASHADRGTGRVHPPSSSHPMPRSCLQRDIKTGNIFLCGGDYVQLGDFGLASVRDENDAEADHDQSLVGTPQFMSPELLSRQGYTHQTDVW